MLKTKLIEEETARKKLAQEWVIFHHPLQFYLLNHLLT